MRIFIYQLHACAFDACVIYKMKGVKENENITFKEFEKAIADEFRSLSIKTKNYYMKQKEIADKDYSKSN